MKRLLIAACALSAAGIACADDAAPAAPAAPADAPPPQGWSGKGELGYVNAKGNTNSDALNAKLGIADQVGPWKHSLTVDVLSAKTNGLTSADRDDATWQTNYDLTPKSYVYGNLSYIDDRLSGFAYQANATLGYGRKLIDTADTKLLAQLGVGYGQVQPEILTKDAVGNIIGRVKEDKENAAVVQSEIKFEQVLTKTTKLTDDFKVTYGNFNTYLRNDLALAVSINSKLALSLAYTVIHNTSPPAETYATDTLTTVNLVYSF
jgi:putative salt-induced outer membrane protein